MSAAANIFSQADVTLSEQEDGEVRVNIGNVIDGTGLGAGVAAWGVDGFVGMPNLPSDGQCCVALVLEDGNQQRCIGFKDNRFASKAGELQPGDRAIVSDCGARFLLKQATSSISLFAENEADDDNAMIVNLNGQEGSLTLAVSATTFRLEKDRIVMAAGGTMVQLDSTGFNVFGKHCNLATGGGNFGTVGVLPPPQGVSSILAGVTGMAGAPSTKWTVAVGFALAFLSALVSQHG